jgi:hypothetical protein
MPVNVPTEWWTCHFLPDGRSLDGAVHCWQTVTFFPPGTGIQSDHNPP